MEYNSTGERLKSLRKDKKLTQPQLAKILNMDSASTISKWEHNITIPKGKTITQLSKLYNVTTDYILGKSDDKTVPYRSASDVEQQQVKDNYFQIFRRLDNDRKEKVIEYMTNEFQSQQIERIIHIQTTQELLKIQDAVDTIEVEVFAEAKAGGEGFEINPKPIGTFLAPAPIPIHDLAFRITGNSMEPFFMDGDIVYIRKVKFLKNGDIGVIYYLGKYYLKKVKLNKDEGTTAFVALNKDYPDIVPKKNEHFEIIGKVVI